jgi:O-antigen ligase
MPQRLALLIFVVFIVALIVRDLRRREGVSSASWLPLMWAVIFASRPVSAWFQSGSGMTSAEAYLDGSPTDRMVFLILIALGVMVLAKRRIALGSILSSNKALFAFYGYCLLSIAWSDIPFVAFKRLFKDFGSVIMILVLLTEANPINAIKATFVRCAYVLVPMSMLFVRYYPDIGRIYTGYSANDLMYVGVAAHKNTLGALLLVSTVFLLWDIATGRRDAIEARVRLFWLDGVLVMLMALRLLRIADSATSILCTIVGSAIFLASGRAFIRKRARFLEIYAIAGIGAWFLLDSLFHITEFVVLSLGRDMTLTTRTDAWDLFLHLGINPVFGAGFKSFWEGDRMVRIWRDFPGIVQAHNGYIETYLEGGVVGLIFLSVMLYSGFCGIKARLAEGEAFGRLGLTFWIVTLIYNFSEAAFTQLSLLWIVTLLVVIAVPAASQAEIRTVPVAAKSFPTAMAKMRSVPAGTFRVRGR